MNTLQIILTIIIALAGYPIGLLIAWLADDELEQGKNWFKIIIVVCLIGIILSIIFAMTGTLLFETLLFLVASFIFIALLALASLVKFKLKSKKLSKWLKKRK